MFYAQKSHCNLNYVFLQTRIQYFSKYKKYNYLSCSGWKINYEYFNDFEKIIASFRQRCIQLNLLMKS